jgi:hypothetical protein
MTMRKKLTDIKSFEYDWLGIDADEHVVFFSTAGGGYAPEGFIEDTEIHKAAIAEILAMPRTTMARFAPILAPIYVNTWLAVAERGLYAFDSDPNGYRYKLVAAPNRPILLKEVAPSVSVVLRRTRLPRLKCEGLDEAAKIADAVLMPTR